MLRSSKISKRTTAGLVVAAALLGLSLANWLERGRFGVPEDGVMWADREAGVLASWIAPESPAARVGVRPGDRLLSIDGHPVGEALDATRALAGIGAWGRAEYVIERDGEARRFWLVAEASLNRSAVGGFLLLLGWIYAAIGLCTWLRCPRDRAAARFFAFCMGSLALYSLSSTGELTALDRLVYWLDAWALLLVPPLFLDFAARFADGAARWRTLTRASYAVAVGIGAAHHAAAGEWISGAGSTAGLVRFFESAPLALLAANLLAASAVTRAGIRTAERPMDRLRMRWLAAGAAAATAPFACFYVAPFLLGAAPGPNQAFSVLSLAALPAAIAVALLRYRVMDFEPFRRRTVASAAAVGILLAAGYTILFRDGAPARWLSVYGPAAWTCSVALAAALYFPIRKRLLVALEKRAYRERYEQRRTLADFGTELAAETDAGRMVALASERLAGALETDRVAILGRLPESGSGRRSFRLLHAHNFRPPEETSSFDLGAVAERSGEEGSSVTLAHSRDGDLAGLGCRHFVPCRLRNDTLAWIALGPAADGSFLTTEDLCLVEALAGPLAVALENARLYASLEAKAAQYRRLKDYNENIVESLSVGILVTDLDSRVRSWNTQLELAFHISRDQAIGRRLDDLLPPALAGEIDRCQGDSGGGQSYKFPVDPADFPDEFRPAHGAALLDRRFNIAVSPLITRQFERIGRLVILDDVTDRVNLERQLVRADKLSATGLLAAGVAHEVNTPLAVISSYAQLLATRFSEDTAESRMLGKVTEQTFRASEIVNSLLDFSRVSGAVMEPCDINRCARDTLELLAPQLRQAGVAVVRKLDATARVRANRGQLQQVLLNLFLNAKDAMPRGGTLAVSTRTAADAGGGRVEVLVSDTGTGIPPEVRDRIFDPFFTTKGARQGTGLGLAISYGIVREHGGAISVDSASGEGTQFTVSLPAAPQPIHA